MNITRSIIIDAPLDTVWHTAAHEFDQISVWASLVSDSEAATDGETPAGADLSGRVCSTPFGKTYEQFETYNEADHSFTYAVSFDKMPGFIKKTTNTWKVEAVGTTQSRLSMSADMDLNLFPGSLMRLPMSFQMGRTLVLNLEEIKHYIETGKPHPRKVKQLEKAAG